MKKKLVKIVMIGVAALVMLVVAGMAVVYMQRNVIAKKAIEKVGTYVVMAPVTVEGVKLQLLQGEAELTGLSVGNPEGFKTKEAISVTRVHVKMDIGSLRSDVLHINLIEVDQPHITVEQGFRSNNLKQLAENAKRLSGEKATSDHEEAQQAGKQMVIDKILVSNGQVGMSAPVLHGQQLNIPLPKVEMNDFGKESEPITVADSIQRFILEIYAAILKAGQGIIPPNLMGSLSQGLDSLRSGLGSATGTLSDTAGEAGTALGEGVEKSGEALKEGAGSITEGVRGIFGRKQSDE